MKKNIFVCMALLFCCALCAAEVKLSDGWVAKHSGNFEIKAVKNGFSAKILKGGAPLEVRKTVKFAPNSRLDFSADVKSNIAGAVQLQIIQLDGSGKYDKTKPRIYNSRYNFSSSDKLIAESDVRNENPITICVNISPDKRGGNVTVTNLRAVNPTGDGNAVLEVAPSYISAGYELSNLAAGKADDFKAQAFYREKDGEFMPAYTPDFPPFEHKARGVLVNLKENTQYELKLVIDDNGKKSTLTKKFCTLGAKLPIAQNITVTPEMIKKGLIIKKSGNANGYIRYTAKPGTVLESNGVDAVTIQNVNYIILDGLTLRGGKENSIKIRHSKNIVIRNCDIAKFGRVGIQKTHRGGEFYVKNNKILNSDAGIWMQNVKNILVENNFIHDPNGFTNPWFYSHPTGPKAINAGMIENATIRFNDFIGGDVHRWNDAVEGMDNSGTTGGFYRNAEIYGNLFALSNDDGIELEGGEINTRFFCNRVESTLCGVSSGSCARGPSYIFSNLFWRGNDIFGLNFNSFKNGHSIWNSGKVHFFNNTATGYRHGTNAPSADTYRPRLDKMVNLNNIYALRETFGSPNGLYKIANCQSDYNLVFNPQGVTLASLRKDFDREHNGVEGDPQFTDAVNGNFSLKETSPARGKGCTIPNFMPQKKVDIGAFQYGKEQMLPLRPLAFVTDTAIVDFKTELSSEKSVILSTKCPKAEIPFTIAKTYEADWLEVTPANGVITKDKPVVLKVKINASKFKTARINRTVFLVRTANGISRPVSVEADTRNNKALLKANRKDAIFAEVKNSGKATEFSCDVPEDGYYFLMLYGKVANCRADVYCDGKKLYSTKTKHPYAVVVMEHENISSYFCLPNWVRKNIPIRLSAGKHNFKIVFSNKYAPGGAALIKNANDLMHAACIR